jgi:hypothetical protein
MNDGTAEPLQQNFAQYVWRGFAADKSLQIGAASGDRTHDILSHSQAFCR